MRSPNCWRSALTKDAPFSEDWRQGGFGIYIHWPFCEAKCPYCDFNSHVSRSIDQAAWKTAYLSELRRYAAETSGRTVTSVFFGGGTPSLFSPDALDRLIGGLRSRLRLAGDCEFTLEANPGTFEKERFHAFRHAGVNRLSVGVQSFNDQHLKALGRVHNADQAMAAVEEAALAFETFNIDLMYALPGQTLANLEEDLNTLLAFEPPHVSVYHLTIEPNTVFAKFPPQVPHDDDAYAMLDRITERTAMAGMQRYEVSAYAKPNHRCWHNLNYWQFGDYLGIGAGAHSKLSFAHRVVRQVRYREPALYMQQAMKGEPVTQNTEVSRQDLPFEFMLNALRLKLIATRNARVAGKD